MTYLAMPVAYEKLLKLLQVRSDFRTPAGNIRYLEKLKLEVIYGSSR